MINSNVFEKTILPFLGKTAKYAGFYFSDSFHENGIDLSKEQWLVLKILNLKDGQKQNDLAFITDRSKTSLTRLIKTMEKKNLVYRIHSVHDKRVNHVYISKTGKLIFKKSLPILNDIISELEEGISKNDIEITIQVLKKIENNINKNLNKI